MRSVSRYISLLRIIGGEGCDGDGILETGDEELDVSSSASPETKYPYYYVGGCTTEEPTLKSSSKTGVHKGGLALLSSVKGITSGTAQFFHEYNPFDAYTYSPIHACDYNDLAHRSRRLLKMVVGR